MTAPSIPPIVKEVVVAVGPAAAFAAFTAEVRRWWPVATHSVGGEAGLGLRLDELGFVETLADGTQCEWGEVLAWEPPHRLLLTWHPGSPADPHTQVEVTFTAARDGTLVRLVHSGWEALPVARRAGRHEYESGWDAVLGDYASAVAGGRGSVDAGAPGMLGQVRG
jgi:uncharacterized protein YndB with AHSA1/START domain